MNNQLKVFANEEFGDVRTIIQEGNIWFIAKDVTHCLGYKNNRDAINRHVDTEDKDVVKRDTLGGVQDLVIINESGLYSLILSSKLPQAKEFKRWVTSVVLPSIRKNGGYIAQQEKLSDTELMAKALLVAQNVIASKDKQIEELTPKADYFDALVDRNLLTNFRETAIEFGIKEKVFIQWLLDKKYVYRNTKNKLMPYADKNKGYFELKESFSKSSKWKGTQTLITPKGREAFRLLFSEVRNG